MWLRNLFFVAVCLTALAGLTLSLLPRALTSTALTLKTLTSSADDPAELFVKDASFREVVQAVDDKFSDQWLSAALEPSPRASQLAIVRRLSLALLGTIPSLEEIRHLESLPKDRRVDHWLGRVFADRRYYDYLAERFARAYVGTEDGPFLIYRRRRFVLWLSDQIEKNRPYDRLARDVISSDGLWTDSPPTNFVTVTITDDDEGVDEARLAGQVTRAFLGVRLDCAECHDHPFEDWSYRDFHQLAAFFGSTEQSFTGIRDGDQEYETENPTTGKRENFSPDVPFYPELLVRHGSRRRQLALWVTDRENRAFARTAVNRVWTLMFGRSLTEAVDNVPLDDDSCPEVLRILGDDFAAHGFNLRRLIRVIAATRLFQLDSRADHPLTPSHDEHWATFGISRLRPEQIVGSVLQSASLTTLDYDAHIIKRIAATLQQNEFIKRYGDAGADELADQGGTIPQRLVMMNGNLVHERTESDLIMNASTRVAALAADDAKAVEVAYLAVLTRRPTKIELRHFTARLGNARGNVRKKIMQDVYWALLNSSEFSWNH